MSEAIEQARPRLLIDIVTDPVCPWCHVGLKAFFRARDRIAEEFQVLPRIRAFLLNPDMPPEGVDRKTHYEGKFPDEKRREQTVQALQAAAMGAGFKFDPTIPTWLPNTVKAHQIIRLAHFDGAQERVTDAIFEAFWNDGANIGEDDVLIAIAESAGLDADNARRDLSDARSKNTVLAEAEAFRRAGVTGVPTYIINERDGFSGAMPPDRMAKAFVQAAEKLQAS